MAQDFAKAYTILKAEVIGGKADDAQPCHPGCRRAQQFAGELSAELGRAAAAKRHFRRCAKLPHYTRDPGRAVQQVGAPVRPLALFANCRAGLSDRRVPARCADGCRTPEEYSAFSGVPWHVGERNIPFY
jgi:hypothetical protein